MQTQTLQPLELHKLKEEIKDIRTAMLTTQREDGEFHSRPMATHDVDDDGSMWFFTYKNSNKVREIQQNDRVSLGFVDTGDETYVAISGNAEVVDDRQKIEELWNDVLKTWFPDGKDDPNITLLKVTTHSGEYWDRPGGKMMQLFEMAKGALTGQPDTSGRDEKFGEEPR
ncbi:pyridoxamine 5'-phosphate oxidase-related FMN-binding protein [Fibrisoma limi BUZ 3]|uniref:Pyridoxamine 5'-phosphate oxidase-related FMN-binding protein n=1 Tax=Fibrisoma limi BUZ 3 TaxID=1185876 RepID=I2GJA5_9BACT|nr:pyridoxamine 5'-phosphate oxidase family protein [Fibrisoma limi]CCH53980.1 pyridoxamine 5'-phosphate oxidase-related FMN-binding protein [Fibrisoma limi BUZ 3]